MNFLQKAGRSGGREVGDLEALLMQAGGGADAAAKTGIGLRVRAVKGLKENPIVAGMGAGAGYGASEMLDEEEPEGIEALLKMLGLG